MIPTLSDGEDKIQLWFDDSPNIDAGSKNKARLDIVGADGNRVQRLGTGNKFYSGTVNLVPLVEYNGSNLDDPKIGRDKLEEWFNSEETLTYTDRYGESYQVDMDELSFNPDVSTDRRIQVDISLEVIPNAT